MRRRRRRDDAAGLLVGLVLFVGGRGQRPGIEDEALVSRRRSRGHRTRRKRRGRAVFLVDRLADRQALQALLLLLLLLRAEAPRSIKMTEI